MNALKKYQSQKPGHFQNFRKSAWIEIFVSKKGAWLGKRGCMVALDFHYISIQLLRLDKMSVNFE
jgi:hypothetical protein